MIIYPLQLIVVLIIRGMEVFQVHHVALLANAVRLQLMIQ